MQGAQTDGMGWVVWMKLNSECFWAEHILSRALFPGSPNAQSEDNVRSGCHHHPCYLYPCLPDCMSASHLLTRGFLPIYIPSQGHWTFITKEVWVTRFHKLGSVNQRKWACYQHTPWCYSMGLWFRRRSTKNTKPWDHPDASRDKCCVSVHNYLKITIWT